MLKVVTFGLLEAEIGPETGPGPWIMAIIPDFGRNGSKPEKPEKSEKSGKKWIFSFSTKKNGFQKKRHFDPSPGHLAPGNRNF